MNRHHNFGCFSAMRRRLWLTAVVFMTLHATFCTSTVLTFNESQLNILPMASISFEVNEQNSNLNLNETHDTYTKPPGNVTSVSDWVLHNKKKAAIGMIIGVVIALLIVIICCCCVSKVASEKIKRKKKKKGSVLRGLKKFFMPKFKIPKPRFFKVQPKGNLGKEIKNIGSLMFSLYYEKRTAELFIKIKKAEDLSLKSSSEVSFNYVVIELDPYTLATQSMGALYETKRVRNSVAPIFNDVITIKILPQELVNQTLTCFVYDENRISPRDLIGAVTIELESVYKSIYGKEKDFNETLKWRSGERGGDILLGFRWNPKDEIFYLTVKECMNLSVAEVKGKPTAYVKVEVFDGPHRVFQETTGTKSKTAFPVFNELFMFSLTDQQKKTICLIISVKHRASLLGKKYTIGQLSFSFRAIGEELEHWKTTMSTGKDVEMMHPLHAAVEVPRKQREKHREGEDIVDVLTDEENLTEDEEDRLL